MYCLLKLSILKDNLRKPQQFFLVREIHDDTDETEACLLLASEDCAESIQVQSYTVVLLS